MERLQIEQWLNIDNNCLIIKIMDNGIGMSRKVTEKLLSGEIHSKTGGGFGVKNTHERLQLHYGSIYGLTYYSKTGKGTTVTVKIPPTVLNYIDTCESPELGDFNSPC